MTHTPKLIVTTLARTFAIGVSGGMRTQVPLAMICRAAADGRLPKGRGRIWDILPTKRAGQITALLMAGEFIGDKLPSTPSRLAYSGKFIRPLFGAAAGALLASGLGGRSGGLAVAALAGGLGGVVGTYGGYHARVAIVEDYEIPDAAVGVAEDLVSLSLARLALAETV